MEKEELDKSKMTATVKWHKFNEVTGRSELYIPEETLQQIAIEYPFSLLDIMNLYHAIAEPSRTEAIFRKVLDAIKPFGSEGLNALIPLLYAEKLKHKYMVEWIDVMKQMNEKPWML